jgi:hypothetical protein
MRPFADLLTEVSAAAMPENPEVSNPVERARQEVLGWLQEPHRNPMFLAGKTEAQLTQSTGRIVERFMSWSGPAGFEGHLRQQELTGTIRHEVHWTYRGSELVGFKQPPLAGTADEAWLLGAAALLRNEWCRKRMP